MTGQSLTVISGLVLLAVILVVVWRARRHRYNRNEESRQEPGRHR